MEAQRMPRASADGAPVPDTSADRRTAPRRRKQIQVVLSDPKDRTPDVNGWVLDRSLGGLCLTVSQPVFVGTQFCVRTTDAPASAPSVLIKVKNAREQDGRWELGCQFLDNPPYSVLLLFG
jgi:hypothetical protein